MTNINEFISLHDVNFKERPKAKEISIGLKKDLENFISSIIERRLKGKGIRAFKKKDDSTTVISNLKEILKAKGSQGDSIQKIADHLLEKEQDVDETQSKTIEKGGEKKVIFSVKRGVLVQALQKYDESLYYLLAKIEFDTFIEEEEWVKRQGLPLEKQVLKSCLFKIDETAITEDIRIYDSNPRVARYWWDGFLELKEKRTDEENTRGFEAAFEYKLTKLVKKVSYFDYSNLIDRLRQYYQAHKDFDFDELLEEVFENYQPVNKRIKMKEVIDSLRSLPEKRQFDERFPIIHSQLRDKIRFIFNPHDKIELHLKDYLENFKNIIKTEIDESGVKWLKIKITDKEYKRFTVS
jgi:hypothetical protein